MNCPTCQQAMEQTFADVSDNPKNGHKYDRLYLVCRKDDVWITAELPKAKRPDATINYTNWRGETANRRIVPQHIWFGKTEWHPEEQWFLHAFDTLKKVERDFALKDIRQWLD